MKTRTKSSPFHRLLVLFIMIILCSVLVFPMTAGCGGTASNTFLELLNLVPADFAVSYGNQPAFFILIDYNFLYQDEGITFSTFEELFNKTDKNKISYWIIGQGSFITGYGRFASTPLIRKEYVGYDITCIDAEIQFGQPPTDGVAAIGRFSAQATEEALSHRGEWPSWAVADYTTEDYHGVTIHSWGSGFETHLTTRLVPPHIDELGRARPLAVTDKYLFYTPSVETIKMMIDASQNQYSSLAGLPEYAAIANSLAELQAYAAVVGSASLADLSSEQNGGEFSGPLLKKYLTCGTGLGQDEKGPYLIVVLYHESTDNAQANISLLRERTEYIIPLITEKPLDSLVTDMQIDVEDNVLLAKIYTVSPSSLWCSWFYFSDSWLTHE
jgi:hypothetical protein